MASAAAARRRLYADGGPRVLLDVVVLDPPVSPVRFEEREVKSCWDWEYSDPIDPLDLEEARIRCMESECRDIPEYVDEVSPMGDSSPCDMLGLPFMCRLQNTFLTAETVDRELLLRIDSAFAGETWKFESGRGASDFESGRQMSGSGHKGRGSR